MIPFVQFCLSKNPQAFDGMEFPQVRHSFPTKILVQRKKEKRRKNKIK